MRVEDLDRGRVREEYLREQLTDLRWLGLDWDEGPDVGGDGGPYLQSQRTGLYDDVLRALWERNLLYPCHCSRREIAAAATAPHGPDDEGPAYPGTCRGELARRPGDPLPGSGTALRFRVPLEEIHFRDRLQGEQAFIPAESSGDFVVRRKDGIAAYQLAVVVDDAMMGVTEVLRGADLLSSTARQILLYRALGLSQPAWTHVPLVLTADGERFSKRAAAPSLRELREGGHSPDRVVGWLASTCGLASSREALHPAQLIDRFTLDRIPREDSRVTIPRWLDQTRQRRDRG